MWRVGRKVRRNLYRDDEPIAMLATEELAREIAYAMNSVAELNAEVERQIDLRCDETEGWLKIKADMTEREQRLREALQLCLGAFAEIEHARKEPGWFTKGESAAWQHAGEWIRRGVKESKTLFRRI